ncbi:family 10 glycosylhydrolase [Oculatella sp. LEGE 06141]|uniref:family 10 glycosylhydrolase n=1 Tax=Oculatella sp. LEGE 06141 TaxID=1828648 RepID=UPI001882BAFE|nr:family 10 glycosylhydrolase [Oculatella sp. LEGE 06141]MBE9179024.1 family 10 glycosylhydrolase [Oculatella sp. LEGE 06141]
MRCLRPLKVGRRYRRLLGYVLAAALTSSLIVGPLSWGKTAQAQAINYCQMSAEAIAQKSSLLQEALQGNGNAENRYKNLLEEHANQLQRCRQQNWPQNQAIWLRLYPCDVREGALEALLDRIVDKGYNQVYLEVFYNGQVLLPAATNRTAWPASIRIPGYENRDLLAETIQKGHDRGLKVYAWMFSLNYGYSYSQRPGTEQILARNGSGQTSLTFQTAAGLSTEINSTNSEETFIDPYNLQAKRDYYSMVQAVVARKPDGVLFDYIRYPRGSGAASVASRVQDLWIYGSAAQQALYDRGLNQSGRDLIYRYLSKGYITTGDIAAVRSLYPNELEPLWQGRTPTNVNPPAPPDQVRAPLQFQLWQLSVAHAIQGVVDFLAMASLPVQQAGISAGAVFFPEANQPVGQGGYDSRLQPWDRFPANIEWHPMAYGTCGNTGCIVSQVQRVLSLAPPGAQVMPVLAGVWGAPITGRPPLEAQMQSLRQAAPQLNTVSHFAFSWQEPQFDRERKFCRLE